MATRSCLLRRPKRTIWPRGQSVKRHPDLEDHQDLTDKSVKHCQKPPISANLIAPPAHNIHKDTLLLLPLQPSPPLHDADLVTLLQAEGVHV